MVEQLQKVDRIDGKKLQKKHSRRAFFRASIESVLVGAGAGTLTKYGLDYVGKRVGSAFREMEEDLRTMAWNVQVLSGSLERKIRTETEELKKKYSDGTVALYQAAGFASEEDAADIEKLIANSERIQSYYTFSERARELKDRIDKRNLEIGEKLHSLQPKPLQGVNRKITDAYAQMLRRMGYKIPETEEQIDAQRKGYKAKLDDLVRIYDTNENSRVAEGKLLERINSYLSKESIMPEERGMFEFLRDQLGKPNGYENVRNYLKSHDKTEGSDTNFMLRGLLSEMESNFRKVKEDKEYLERLQRVTLDNITIQKRIRQQYEGDYTKVRGEFEGKIKVLKGIVDDTISELKKKGHDIETREEYMEKTPFTDGLARVFGSIFAPVKQALIYGTAAVAGIGTLYARRNAIARKGQKNAFKESVRRHNDLADGHNDLLDSYEGLRFESEALAVTNRGLASGNITISQDNQRLGLELAKYKNPGITEYSDGGGI